MPHLRNLIKIATTKFKNKSNSSVLSDAQRPHHNSVDGSSVSSVQSTTQRSLGTKDSADTEERTQRASRWLFQDARRTIKAAAEKFNVKYWTLRRRRDGVQPRSVAHQKDQLLAPVQEEVLADWCQYLSDNGIPLNSKTIRPRVKALTGKKPGRNWFRRFLGRHPDVVSGRPAGLAPNRAQAVRYPIVQEHFKLWKKHVIDVGIPPENIYNMDEKGLQLGGGRKTRKTKYFFRRDRRPKYIVRNENLELVTVIDCIAADGAGPPPSFIFSGSTFDGRWFENEFADRIGMVAISPNGWTDDFLCLEWFKKVFVPYASKRNVTGLPIVLVFDGHGSHTALEMAEHAEEHNIILFCSPPHTTHYLQPLDVNFFGPVQRRWADRCDDLAMEGALVGERGMTRETLIPEYLAIRDAVMATPDLVKNAFRKTGLYPFDPNVLGDETSPAFAPSHLSSTQAHLPASFPVTIPSAPEPERQASDSDSGSYWSSSHPSITSASNSETSLTEPESQATPTGSSAITPSTQASTVSSGELTPAVRGQRSSSALEASLLERRRSHTELRRMSEEMLFNYIEGLSDIAEAAIAGQQQAESHAALVGVENGRLKALANKPKGKKRETLNINARVITGPEGKEKREAERARKAEKAKLALASKEKEATRVADRLRNLQENAATRSLSGPVNQNRQKTELEEIVDSLSVLSRNSAEVATALRAEGTREVLAERITKYLEANPDLENDERFVDLFRAGGRRSKRPALADPETDSRLFKSPRIALADIPVRMVPASSIPTAASPPISQPFTALAENQPQYSFRPDHNFNRHAYPALPSSGLRFQVPYSSFPAHGTSPSTMNYTPTASPFGPGYGLPR